MHKANLNSSNVRKRLGLNALPYSGQRRTPIGIWKTASDPITGSQSQEFSFSPQSKRKFAIDILDRVFEILDEEPGTSE
jgi:hypothetical protein